MSFFDNLKFKHINEFLELPPLLRLLTGVGIGQIIAGILVISLKQIPFKSITVTYLNNSPVTLSLLLACTIYLLNIIAWSYIIIGVIHTNTVVRLTFLALFSYFMLSRIVGFITSIAAFPVVVFIWIYVLRRQKKKEEQINFKDLRIISFSILIIHAVNIAGAVFQTSPDGGYSFLGIAFLRISQQITYTYLPLIPLLFIAGLDLVEFNINACSMITQKIFAPLNGIKLYIVTGIISILACCLFIYFYGIKMSFITSFVLMAALIFIINFLYTNRNSDELSFNFMLFITISALAFMLIYAFVSAFKGEQDRDFNSILAYSSIIASVSWIVIGTIKVFSKKDTSKSSIMLLVFSLWYFASVGMGAVTSSIGINVTLTANIQYIMLSGIIILLACCIFSVVRKEINREFILRLIAFNLVAAITYLAFLLYDSGVDIDIGALYALTQSTLFLVLPAIYIIKNAWGNKAFRIVVYALFVIIAIFGISIILFPGTRSSILQFMQLFLISIALLWETMQFGERFKESKADKNKYYSNLALYFGYVIFLIMGLIYHDGLNVSNTSFFDPDLIGQFSCAIFGLPIAFMYLVGAEKSDKDSVDALNLYI